jgi:hypothetical protein
MQHQPAKKERERMGPLINDLKEVAHEILEQTRLGPVHHDI